MQVKMKKKKNQTYNYKSLILKYAFFLESRNKDLLHNKVAVALFILLTQYEHCVKAVKCVENLAGFTMTSAAAGVTSDTG